MKCTSHSQDAFVGCAQAVIYCTCVFSLSQDGEVEVVQAVIDVLQSDRVDFNCWKGAIILSAIPPRGFCRRCALGGDISLVEKSIPARGLAAAPRMVPWFRGCAACGVAFNPCRFLPCRENTAPYKNRDPTRPRKTKHA